MIVDLFAGGGGASLGIWLATGRHPDVAIDHSRAAVAMHTANHPTTRHLCEDVFDVEPRDVVGRRRVDLLWASPDCTHHSRAKGGKPRERRRRALATIVLKWAAQTRPAMICLENVEEFASWGPLDEHGHPIREHAGRLFDAWVADLELQGYAVEWRSLVAADYGVPTTRRRLFLVARRDGAPIVWPEPTHGAGRSEPWRTAAEIIDWSIPCPSIFERARQLAEATLRRIARGIQRYVIGAAQPFVVPVTHPRDSRIHGLVDPLPTVTAANRGELALVAPTLIQTGYGERLGQDPRALDLGQPLGTVVAGGAKHALVAAFFLAKHYGGNETPGTPLTRPVDTITTQDHRDEVRAFLVKYYGTASGADVNAPLDTVTARNHFGLVAVAGQDYTIADIGMRMLQPRELFRAQGFPDSYEIAAGPDGKPLTKTQQIELCGNSVCPQVAAAGELRGGETEGGMSLATLAAARSGGLLLSGEAVWVEEHRT